MRLQVVARLKVAPFQNLLEDCCAFFLSPDSMKSRARAKEIHGSEFDPAMSIAQGACRQKGFHEFLAFVMVVSSSASRAQLAPISMESGILWHLHFSVAPPGGPPLRFQGWVLPSLCSAHSIPLWQILIFAITSAPQASPSANPSCTYPQCTSIFRPPASSRFPPTCRDRARPARRLDP